MPCINLWNDEPVLGHTIQLIWTSYGVGVIIKVYEPKLNLPYKFYYGPSIPNFIKTCPVILEIKYVDGQTNLPTMH
jgi:hypothetical protein